jgi:biotin carboxylase
MCDVRCGMWDPSGNLAPAMDEVTMNAEKSRGSIVLVMHTTTYNADAFVRACQTAGAQAIIASDRCHILDRAWRWPSDHVAIDFFDPRGAAAVIARTVRSADHAAVRAVLPVGGETAAFVASLAAEQLGLRGNAPAAAAATANKLRMRELCAQAAAGGASICVPRFLAVPFDQDPALVTVEVEKKIGWPCVIKPLLLSGSRGVMRANDPASLGVALLRLRRMLSAPALLEMANMDELGNPDNPDDRDTSPGPDDHPSRQVLIEEFIGGAEVAIEGLLNEGKLQTLAFFDKPDALDGPFFEETLYVTPSRHPRALQAEVERAIQAAASALGLFTGPVHAEARLAAAGPVVIEVAARSIGGLCSRTLRFGTGITLEDLLVRHALGDSVGGLVREKGAAGVMMIPVPGHGILMEARGVTLARAVPGIEDLVISVQLGETLVPLPEGASYLGFIFARGASPNDVEASLRRAHRHLSFEIAPLLRVISPTS